MAQIPQGGNQPLVTTLRALLALLRRVNQVVTVPVLLDDLVAERSVQGRVRTLFRVTAETDADGLDGRSDDTCEEKCGQLT